MREDACGTRVRVWDTRTGTHDATVATLGGHLAPVHGLAVHGSRRSSSSYDGTIQGWALGAWEALHKVGRCGGGQGFVPGCLVVGGSHLVSGPTRSPCGWRVWGLRAGVGRYVVVWGCEA